MTASFVLKRVNTSNFPGHARSSEQEAKKAKFANFETKDFAEYQAKRPVSKNYQSTS
ncbi:MAG: hypothetical protein V4713_16760 [Pseudomonadota bacterium]